MPASTADRAATGSTTRTLAQVYRRFGDSTSAGTSPLDALVALALSDSDDALRAIAAAPARQRQPGIILAALHDLALAGQAPDLAAAYAATAGKAAAADDDAAARAAVETLLRMPDAVVELALLRQQPRSFATQRCAVLQPAVAEAARRAGAPRIGLVDVGGSPGLNLQVDQVGTTYSDGRSLGDPRSPVQLSASVVGKGPVPTRAVPDVVARVGVGMDPLDPTDAADARWLRASLPPDDAEAAARLEAALAVATGAPAQQLRGDPLDLLPEAVTRVPADALPVVTTTWALSQLPAEGRLRFLHRLDEVAADRAVAWVSVEGVGVAPAVPTFGDRHASGHSIIGVAVLDGATVRVEAVGRCWSRGRWLSWLAAG